ncbi:hypothetical protein [Bradyrhizobium sp. ORS 111]|uniref:hypothetical protein n=1 Tax=Bradyrhizobium sp. ORS 111 TaxID=1685958 RepID=UPI003890A228
MFDGRSDQTATLLAFAVFERRMELHKVTESELEALRDMVASDELPQEPEALSGRRVPPYLKLVRFRRTD